MGWTEVAGGDLGEEDARRAQYEPKYPYEDPRRFGISDPIDFNNPLVIPALAPGWMYNEVGRIVQIPNYIPSRPAHGAGNDGGGDDDDVWGGLPDSSSESGGETDDGNVEEELEVVYPGGFGSKKHIASLPEWKGAAKPKDEANPQRGGNIVNLASDDENQPDPDAYIKTRKERLRKIQETELLHEKTLLQKLVDPHESIAAAQAGSWNGMNYGMVIDMLNKICKRQGLDVNDEWVVRQGLAHKPLLYKLPDKHPHDHGKWVRDPRSQQSNAKPEVQDLLQAVFSPAGGRTLKKYKLRTIIMRRLTVINFLTLLRRFTDLRNPELRQRCCGDKDDLNMNPNLRIAWVLYRVWIRLLNYRSLSIGEEEFGKKQLLEILGIAINRYWHEVRRAVPINGQINDRYFGIKEMLDVAERSIEDFSDEFYKGLAKVNRARRTNLGFQELFNPLPSKPAIVIGLVEEAISKSFKDDGDNRTLELWTDLHHIAVDFENKMQVEHVEDVRFGRKVVLSDEWWKMHSFLKKYDSQVGQYGPGKAHWWTDIEVRSIYDDHEFLARLQTMGQVNLLRRNNLLLRDWSGRRPVKKLYYVFDTREGKEHEYYRTPIDEFYEHIDALSNCEQPIDIDDDSPSRNENIFSGLFSVHPIGMHNVKNVDECSLCSKGLYSTAHELLAELHCKSNHFFHQRCLQTHWNSNIFDTNRCPLGDNKPYDMPGNAGITPEEQNVFDFDDPAKAEREERNKLDESENWYERHRQDSREVRIEMAHLRNLRRQMEKKVSAEMHRNRVGFEFFGYASGPEKQHVSYSVRRRRRGGLFDYDEPASRNSSPTAGGSGVQGGNNMRPFTRNVNAPPAAAAGRKRPATTQARPTPDSTRAPKRVKYGIEGSSSEDDY